MDFVKLINNIWSNTNSVNFGNRPNWDNNTFSSSWFNSRIEEERLKDIIITKPSSEGLYWFITDSIFLDIPRPTTLPASGCDFQTTHASNHSVFPHVLLTKSDKNSRIIYNGHENNVMYRLKTHFSLTDQNTSTGALGINHYRLSSNFWQVKYFTRMDIHRLKPSYRLPVDQLLSSHSGRNSLESAWRVEHGWPPLCKK